MAKQERPLRVLVLCTGNACRSQMAEGWLRHLAAGRLPLEVRSAGLEAHGLNPRAVASMAEVGVDISTHTSDVVADAVLAWADLLITVCGHADEHCPVVPTRVERLHWPLPDPARAEGTEAEVRAAFAAVRDDLRARIESLIEDRIGATGAAGNSPPDRGRHGSKGQEGGQ
ncbi:MAG TPA: arsenate reductase ArsC [Pseudomonadales bacterium]|nr:arsenate reductase ArsC [Pseudomonadales bacterium]